MLLIGCSEMFKNHRLFTPGFRADRLLLNASSTLALGPDLAAIASRRPVPRGFDYVEPRSRLQWRIFVLASGPLCLMIFGLVRSVLARRPLRAVRRRV